MSNEENRVEDYIKRYTVPAPVKEYTGPYKSEREFERYVSVKFDYVGFHQYENAPEQVAFLKHNHRHKFFAEATIEVFHDDRELEFFMVLDQIETKILHFMRNQSNLGSCEMQAEFIANGLLNLYGEHRTITVTVSEDNENSGSAFWRKKDVK